MITLVTAELSSGFNWFINEFRLNSKVLETCSISYEFLAFPESERTELELFDWVKRNVQYQRNICILTNSYLLRDLFRYSILRKKLDCKDFQNLFIDQNNNSNLLFFDKEGRSDHWINGNLDLEEKILGDMLTPNENDYCLNWL